MSYSPAASHIFIPDSRVWPVNRNHNFLILILIESCDDMNYAVQTSSGWHVRNKGSKAAQGRFLHPDRPVIPKCLQQAIHEPNYENAIAAEKGASVLIRAATHGRSVSNDIGRKILLFWKCTQPS
jgi:hypothetical protein